MPAELKNMTFSQISGYADNLIANTFEGVDMGRKFNVKELRASFEIMKWVLTEPLQHERQISQMYGSRFLSRPLSIMGDIVSGKRNEDDEKFFLFSGHDTNVANIWMY